MMILLKVLFDLDTSTELVGTELRCSSSSWQNFSNSIEVTLMGRGLQGKPVPMHIYYNTVVMIPHSPAHPLRGVSIKIKSYRRTVVSKFKELVEMRDQALRAHTDFSC